MRFPIVKTVRCTECAKFSDWGDGEVMCDEPMRKADADSGWDFSKPHMCKYFTKLKTESENPK